MSKTIGKVPMDQFMDFAGRSIDYSNFPVT